MTDAVDLAAALATFEEPWSPRTVAASTTTTSGWSARRASSPGTRTPATDEFFLVLTGSLTIRLDDRDVELGPASSTSSRVGCITSRCDGGAEVALISPTETPDNPGDSPGELTADRRLI